MQAIGKLALRQPPVAKLMHLLSVEHLLWPVGRKVRARPAVNRVAHFTAGEVLPVPNLAGLGALPNQGFFELRRGAQHVEQEFACRVALISVQSLSNGNKPDAVVLQGADVVEAIN